MASDRILERTRQADLQALVANGVPVFRIFGQLRVELSGALSRRHIELFADPNPDPTTGDIQWYAPVPGQRIRLVDCQGPQRDAAERDLARLVDDILAHAERLKRSDGPAAKTMAQILELALEIPSEAHIFVVDSRPVLAGWGHVPRGPAAPQRLLTTMVARVLAPRPPAEAPAPEPDPAPVAPAQNLLPAEGAAGLPPERRTPPARAVGARAYASIQIESGPVVAARPLPWLVPLLWAVLMLILLTIGNLLLQHCAIGWPAPFAREGTLLNYCPLATAAARGAERNRTLLAELQVADQALEAKRNQCAAAVTPENETRNRVQESGGTIGAVNVILTWNTQDDLDLHVTCPNADVIFHKERLKCGGTLDVDKNNDRKPDSMTDRPVENVTWPKGAAPTGTYKVEVDPFRISSDKPVAFKVELLIDSDRVKEYDGRIAPGQGKKQVMEFKIPYDRAR